MDASILAGIRERQKSREFEQITAEIPAEGAEPSESTFEMTISKDEGQGKSPSRMRLDFRDDTTLGHARKLARDLRRALKPYYWITLKVDEDYSPAKDKL